MIYTTQRLRLRFDTMYVCTYWHLKLYAPQAKQDTASSRCATLSLSILVNHSKVVNNQFPKEECYASASKKRQTIIRYFARRFTARREEKIKIGRAPGLCSRTKDVFFFLSSSSTATHIHFYKGNGGRIGSTNNTVLQSRVESFASYLVKNIPVWLLLQYHVASTCRAYVLSSIVSSSLYLYTQTRLYVYHEFTRM